MQLDWICNPVTVYALAAAGLLVSLVLFVSMKREMAKGRHLADHVERLRETDQAAIRGLETELASLRESMQQLEAAQPGPPVGMGINLNKRAKALRMHRRGESIPSISAALEMPSNEVALLLKLQALTNEAVAKTA